MKCCICEDPAEVLYPLPQGNFCEKCLVKTFLTEETHQALTTASGAEPAVLKVSCGDAHAWLAYAVFLLVTFGSEEDWSLFLLQGAFASTNRMAVVGVANGVTNAAKKKQKPVMVRLAEVGRGSRLRPFIKEGLTSVSISSLPSYTRASKTISAQMLPGRQVHVVELRATPEVSSLCDKDGNQQKIAVLPTPKDVKLSQFLSKNWDNFVTARTHIPCPVAVGHVPSNFDRIVADAVKKQQQWLDVVTAVETDDNTGIYLYAGDDDVACQAWGYAWHVVAASTAEDIAKSALSALLEVGYAH